VTGTHAELAAFLRARRARLQPADVGLSADTVPGRRRILGLRREEVAELSGVGVTTWRETLPTGGSGTIRRCSPPTAATCCG
jgi:hypothetical protein